MNPVEGEARTAGLPLNAHRVAMPEPRFSRARSGPGFPPRSGGAEQTARKEGNRYAGERGVLLRILFRFSRVFCIFCWRGTTDPGGLQTRSGNSPPAGLRQRGAPYPRRFCVCAGLLRPRRGVWALGVQRPIGAPRCSDARCLGLLKEAAVFAGFRTAAVSVTGRTELMKRRT